MKAAETIPWLSAEQLTAGNRQTEKAALVYQYAVESANSLWAAYHLTRSTRGSPGGITTYQEQDILRAMVVAAASGLDAALKQLIQESIPSLIIVSDSVREEFEKFARRHLQAEDIDAAVVSPKILARILTSSNPQKRLIEDYVFDATGESLQSADQLLRVCKKLGVDSGKAIGNVQELKEVFAARNQMIHELDIALDSSNRKRRNRSQPKMQNYAERLLGVTRAIIADVDQRIGTGTGAAAKSGPKP